MIAERLGRRPSAVGFIGEIKQPLLDYIVRPVGKIFFDIRERRHVAIHSVAMNDLASETYRVGGVFRYDTKVISLVSAIPTCAKVYLK